MHMKSTKFFAISLMGFLFLYGCGAPEEVPTTQQTQAAQQQPLQVVTSFYPLYELVQKIGGDKVDVKMLVPAGIEPHDYEPVPQQIADLYKADIVILNGAGIEPWGEKISPDLEKNGVRILTLADNIDLLEGTHEEEHADEEHHEDSLRDPHFWLDPLTYLEEGRLITKRLSELAPSNASYYQENLERLESHLQKLHMEYEDDLASCDSRTIVTSHAAFAYLAKRYNLAMMPISGFSPEEEPSAHRLAELAKMVKEKNIQYVFTETLVSPKIAQTLADETQIQTLVLNPLEGLTDEEMKADKNYIAIMEENLGNLKTGLGCKAALETQQTQAR